MPNGDQAAGGSSALAAAGWPNRPMRTHGAFAGMSPGASGGEIVAIMGYVLASWT
jgi:hypothetical protein